MSIFSGYQVKIVYGDFAKTLDTIEHEILNNKLKMLNLPMYFISLVVDYLTDRTQRVVVGNYISHPFTLLCEVPQGSALGSPLFTVYINNIIDNFDSMLLIFADDVSLSLRNFEFWRQRLKKIS